MSIRLRHFIVVLLIFTGTASACAVTHMDTIPAFIMIAPGYATAPSAGLGISLPR